MPAEEVTVLGAGLVGICTALSLLERGVSVRLIDRGEPGQETSFGNAGVISPWSIVPQSMPGLWRSIPGLMLGRDRPLAVRAAAWPRMIPWGLKFLKSGREENVRRTAAAMALLCGPSIDLYRRHLTDTGGEHLVQDACYIHAFRDPDASDLEALGFRLRREHGAELHRISGKELRALEPALSPDFTSAVVITGQARALSPGAIGRSLAAKVQALGGQILRRSVTGLQRRDEHWSIDCEGDRFTAKKVVLALGVWSPELLRALGVSPPLMAERGYHVEFPEPGVELRNSVMDVDRKVVASSMLGGLRVAGQAEFAPLDAPEDPAAKDRLGRIARAMLPDLSESQTARVWMGRRPSFPDSLPAIGEMPGLPDLVWNFGHSHYGLMMAPKSGELAADMILGRPANADLSLLSPERFR
ncbi:MAG: FAD-dependent oxidoreductase [Pseudomonadota bacterium]